MPFRCSFQPSTQSGSRALTMAILRSTALILICIFCPIHADELTLTKRESEDGSTFQLNFQLDGQQVAVDMKRSTELMESGTGENQESVKKRSSEWRTDVYNGYDDKSNTLVTAAVTKQDGKRLVSGHVFKSGKVYQFWEKPSGEVSLKDMKNSPESRRRDSKRLVSDHIFKSGKVFQLWNKPGGEVLLKNTKNSGKTRRGDGKRIVSDHIFKSGKVFQYWNKPGGEVLLKNTKNSGKKRSGDDKRVVSDHIFKSGNVFQFWEKPSGEVSLSKMKDSGKSESTRDLDEEQEMTKDSALKHLLSKRRSRREVTIKKYTVGVLLFIDYCLYQKFLANNLDDETAAEDEIKRYFIYVVKGVDQRFRNIPEQEGLEIVIKLRGFVVAKKADDSPWFEKYRVNSTVEGDPRDMVDVAKALPAFEKYVEDNADKFTSHDHAMAFTCYNLFSESSGPSVAGFAPVGGICKGKYAVSLTEAYGGFSSIGVASHELGHNLGSQHDGGDSHPDCSSTSNMVMSPGGSNQNLGNVFLFSKCSDKDFLMTLNNIAAKCVLDEETISEKNLWDLHMKHLAGDLYTKDSQCKNMNFPKQSAGACGNWIYEKTGMSACNCLWCKNSDGTKCVTKYTPPVDGTDCGPNMWCIQGKCVARGDEFTTTAKPTSASCTDASISVTLTYPSGEEKLFTKCSALVTATGGSFCTQNDDNSLAIQKSCCASCAASTQ